MPTLSTSAEPNLVKVEGTNNMANLSTEADPDL